MRANQAEHSLELMARLLGRSTSGYHAWKGRGPSKRSQVDAQLMREIEALHSASSGLYGAPRIHAELKAKGWRVGRKRVARLMREAGLKGVTRRRYVVTTQRGQGRPAPDRVNRDFRADRPNQLWVADITHIPTATSALYLAVVLDVWSRRVVGWAMDTEMPAELVRDALKMALQRRRPTEPVIHHSDQGSQYTSRLFADFCADHNVLRSMGSVGDCYDNAMAESFFATLECELQDRVRFENPRDARRQVFDYIEGFYCTRRRHSSIGYLAPITFEKQTLTLVATSPTPTTNYPQRIHKL
jgi:putative transposase